MTESSLPRLIPLCLLALAVYGPLGCGGGGKGSDDDDDAVTNLAPMMEITAPDDGSTYAVGDLIRFVGRGTDPEDGDIDPNVMTWRSDLDGALGVSNIVNTDKLRHGVHTITLRGVDSDDEPGFATIQVTVLAEIRPPTPGALVITEVMVDPEAVADADGEWFEIHNTTEYQIDLKGLWFQDDTSVGFQVIGTKGTHILEPYGYFVFGPNRNTTVNGGVPVDYAYTNLMTLDDDVDQIVIHTSIVEIDRVDYDATWPWATGIAMSLCKEALNAADNDDPANWCEPLAIYGMGDRGTPGEANPICP